MNIKLLMAFTLFAYFSKCNHNEIVNKGDCRVYNDSATAIIERFLLHEGNASIETAISLLKKSIACDSGNAVFQFNLIDCYLTAERYDSALIYTNQYIQRFNDPYHILLKATLFKKLNIPDSVGYYYRLSENRYNYLIKSKKDNINEIIGIVFLYCSEYGKDSALKKYNQLLSEYPSATLLKYKETLDAIDCQ